MKTTITLKKMNLRSFDKGRDASKVSLEETQLQAADLISIFRFTIQFTRNSVHFVHANRSEGVD